MTLMLVPLFCNLRMTDDVSECVCGLHNVLGDALNNGARRITQAYVRQDTAKQCVLKLDAPLIHKTRTFCPELIERRVMLL